ncbi:MAG TPA: PD-(D/E)XK nuclease family protein, partial [Acidimicrobiales bacterium]|nr:PD-(D/E)XK nuclease family protein [Acidimicrobiales bacterium]
LNVSKHALATVHGCEAMFLANEEQPFEWTTATATGTVAHKAIELSVHWRGDAAPGDLVDEGIARLIAGTDGLGDYLAGLGEGERADLRSGAVERTTMFLECFPPLESRWRPVTESRLRADLCADRVVLRGKVDLTVGRADGLRAGKVLLDLKTGGFSPSHREDLRFYALLETLRLGVPPRLLATYYLDQGRLQQEIVSEDLLESALHRVVGGVEALVDLVHSGRPPVLRPGPPCRWCQIRVDCEAGQAWLSAKVDEEGW